ncbi:MAG TPA: hydrogenase maturation peptidase HycI [Methanothermococcus okinawensis]|uniref:Hydrogenase maturation peptidase HycI n=1 Tax=Methanothermococcus okinawensis TaxID=155863 RepID=A0A832ZYQ4_9EURY|nr:hydrogenase maturation peptidase HycI [Methanothermococcus okinawensis]
MNDLDVLKEHLRDCKKLAVLGIGNPLRGDDGLGVFIVRNVVRHYRDRYPEQKLNIDREVNNISNRVILINCGTVPENFTDILKEERPDKIVIVDCAMMGERPGTVKLIDVEDIGGVGFSTHTLPLNVIVKYLRRYLDSEIFIVGMEPENLDFGVEGLSERIYRRSLEFTEILIDLIDAILER